MSSVPMTTVEEEPSKGDASAASTAATSPESSICELNSNAAAYLGPPPGLGVFQAVAEDEVEEIEELHDEVSPPYAVRGRAWTEDLSLSVENHELAEENARLTMVNENMRLAMENEILRRQCAMAQAPFYNGMGGMPSMPMSMPLMGYGSYPAMPMPGHMQAPWAMPGNEAAGGSRRQRGRDGAAASPAGDARPRAMTEMEPSTQVAPKVNMEDSQSQPPRAPPAGPLTTVMFRNVPNNYSRLLLQQLLDSEGFKGKYDFVYLPMDFKSSASLGYAFVNLIDKEEAERLKEAFEGFSRWAMPSQKVCNVDWSSPFQGLESHIERFRNSPVMHESVPDEHKPALFTDGQRRPFPPPTRKLRVPRVRPGR